MLFTTNNKLLCDVGVEQMIINAIMILYMDHLISKYLFLHFTIEKFGIDLVCIQRVILLVNWNGVFSNKTADEKVKSLNKILLNIFENFIPNKVIKVDYKYPN